MSLKHTTAKFLTAPYHELVRQFGMRPRYRLAPLDDRFWAFVSPDKGLLRLSHEEALEVMAVNALLWLRHDLSYNFSEDDIAAKSPARLLRDVRDTARTLLGMGYARAQ